MKHRKQSYFKKLGSSLPKIIDKNIKKKNFIELSVINNWNEIVGKDIAKFSWPIKISFNDINNLNGRIFVKTERGRSMEIEFKSQEIIEKLNQFFGYKAINKINIIQDFNSSISEKKKNKITKKKIKKNYIKDIKKIKKESVKIALKKLNKSLFS